MMSRVFYHCGMASGQQHHKHYFCIPHGWTQTLNLAKISQVFYHCAMAPSQQYHKHLSAIPYDWTGNLNL
jgi:hypothetical protein